MRFCLKNKSLAGFGVLLLGCSLGAAAPAESTEVAAQRIRVRSVVRADSRTGRLVRRVIVSNPESKPKPVDAIDAGAVQPIQHIVEEAARKHDVDPLLVHSVIQVESAYNPYAISPKGAEGLMQLMPATARRFGVRNTFDVQQNIEGGVRYLKFLSDLFPQDPQLAIAAYNAGEGAVWKYNNNVPPYRETTEYVQKVGRAYGAARKAARTNKTAQTPAPQPAANAEPVYAVVEHFVDSAGRLHLRTVSADRNADPHTRVITP